MRQWLLAVALAAGALPARAAPPDPTGFASYVEIRSAIAAMAREMKPGQHFAWHPLVRDGVSVAALEYWTAPGRPAVHPTDAEYTIVVEGSGMLVSGGRLIDATTTRADLIEGSRIEGGTTRALAIGDVVLIPAGTPHWFGVNGGKLVLLGIKLTRPPQ